MTKIEKSLAEPRPGSHRIQNIFEVSKEKTFRLATRSHKETATLARYLLTKFYVRGEELSKDEETLLDLIHQYYSHLRKDSSRTDFLQTLSVVQMLRLWRTFRREEYPRWALAQLAILQKKVALNPRAFLGIKGTFSVATFVKVSNRSLRKVPKPKRHIGVGYRDQGTAANKSIDANPSWQEVASAERRESLDSNHPPKKIAFYDLSPYKVGIS